MFRSFWLLSLAVGAIAAPATGLVTRQDAGGCTLNWNGTTITGVKVEESCRYTVRYGTAERWGYSTPGNQDGVKAAEFPPMCPQGGNNTNQAEDCLYAVVYTPANMSTAADAPKLPVFVWIHGGSFILGSASDDRMDGTVLSPTGNLISVFMQYRLDPNFGTRDAILALQTVKENIGAAGGDPAKVTIGGQSAGAAMIRSLLGAPAAKGLYRGVILQSDPMNFGAQRADQLEGLQKLFYGNQTLGNCTDLDCFKKIPVQTILAAQADVNDKGPTAVPGVALGLIFRPQAGTDTIPTDTSNLLVNNPAGLAVDVPNIPILLTTVKNETGYNVQTIFKNPMPALQPLYELAITTLLNKERGKIVLDSGLYPLYTGDDGLRISIDKVATDAAFRCVDRQLMRSYAGAGGKVWVGEWDTGVSFPFNSEGYCLKPGAVCHSDDLFPTFGTSPQANLTTQTTALQAQVHRSWVSFIVDGTPSPEGVNWKQWTANSTDSDVQVLGEGSASVCPTGLWGEKIKWDFQLWSNTTSPNATSTGGNGAASSSAAPKPSGSAAPLGCSVVAVLGSVGIGLLL